MKFEKLVSEIHEAKTSEMSRPDLGCWAYIELKVWWNIWSWGIFGISGAEWKCGENGNVEILEWSKTGVGSVWSGWNVLTYPNQSKDRQAKEVNNINAENTISNRKRTTRAGFMYRLVEWYL